MSSHGSKDRVAIVGMGCTPFKEQWDKGVDDMLIDAVVECLSTTGLSKEDIDAWWLGTAQSGMSGITAAAPWKLQNKPVTRVENYCATGSEELMAAYPENALKRIWKAQHCSYWMTTMLHITPDATEFDKRRGLGELALLTDSLHAQRYLAESYTGWDYGVDDWR